MATHQAIGGIGDDEFVHRMVKGHDEKYGEAFWNFFTETILFRLPANPTIIDLGCGPGLFLREISQRLRQATLYGYDVTQAMIEYAKRLTFASSSAPFALHDVESQPVPLATDSVHLICMTSVLHVLDEPLPVLAEIRRLLTPQGIFMLHDWVRTPLQDYISSRVQGSGDELAKNQRLAFRLFPAHNKYSEDDWRWLLSAAGFNLLAETQLRPHHRIFVAANTQL